MDTCSKKFSDSDSVEDLYNPVKPGKSSSPERRMSDPDSSDDLYNPAKPGQEDSTSAGSSDHFKCAYCGNVLVDPQILGCLHSVCADCVPCITVKDTHLRCAICNDDSTRFGANGTAVALPCNGNNITCFAVPNKPLSRQVEGMRIVRSMSTGEMIACGNAKCKGVQRPATHFCIDCNKFFCEPCQAPHDLCDTFEDHRIKLLAELHSLSPGDMASLVPDKKEPFTCPRHKGRLVEYQCESCQVLMCQVCTTERLTNSPHSPKFLNSSSGDSHLQAVLVTQQVAVEFDNFCNLGATRSRTEQGKLVKGKEKIKGEIHLMFKDLRRTLQAREDELISSLEDPYAGCQKDLGLQASSFKRERELLQPIHATLSMLTACSNQDLVAFETHVRAKQYSMTATQTSLKDESSASRNISFSPRNKEMILKAIKALGALDDGVCAKYCKIEPDPSTAVVTGSEMLRFSLITHNSKKVACSHGGDVVRARLRPQSPFQGPAINATVMDSQNGGYMIVFRHTYPHKCNLSVTVNGSHVKDSPFSVNLHKMQLPKLCQFVYDLKVQSSVALQRNTIHPWGVAISSQGTLFVVDNKKNHIMVFEEGRKQTKKLFGPGSGYMQLSAPSGLAFDNASGYLFICDCENNRVEVVKEDGSYVTSLTNAKLAQPYGVAVNEVDKNVYVACLGSVVVLTLEGVLVRRFGTKGDSPGCMIRPSGVAFSRDGDLFVLDHDRVCVMVFTPEGGFLREFGNDLFKCPTDILVTADDQVLVADVLNFRVAVFDLHGKLEGSISVGKPHGLAIDSSGRLYVTDNLAKKCQVVQ